jgi:hypothetical protein
MHQYFSINSTTFVKKIKMRLISNIPHPRYTIQIFHLNAKYVVKIELGQFEQIFKIGELDVNGLDELILLVNENLLNNCLDRFISMRSDWSDSYQEINNKK